MRRPAIEGARNARLPRSGFVPLTKRTGTVTVEPHHLCQRCNTVRDLTRITRECRRGLHDRTGVRRVVVAARFQRVTCGRTERSGMEIVIAKATLSQAIESRRVDWATERGRCAKTHIVNQNDDDIRCALWCFHLEKRGRFYIAHIQLFKLGWIRLSKRKVRAIDLVSDCV